MRGLDEAGRAVRPPLGPGNQLEPSALHDDMTTRGVFAL